MEKRKERKKGKDGKEGKIWKDNFDDIEVWIERKKEFILKKYGFNKVNIISMSVQLK